MAEKIDGQNRRAANVNPLRSGMRTGNPQLSPQKPQRTGKKPATRRRKVAAKADQQPRAR